MTALRPSARVGGRWGAIGIAVIAAGLLLVLTSSTAAFGLARGTAFAPCRASDGGWQVLATAGADAAPTASPTGLGVVRVSISGLDPNSCDGLPARVDILGNDGGIQARPANLSLSTLDTRRNPCTGLKVADPVSINDGAVVLNGCAAGGPGGFASIRNTAAFRVTIGETTTVLGEHTTRSASTGTSGTLPFTGDWSARLSLIGLLLMLAGWCLVAVARRRRSATGHGVEAA